MHNLIEYQIELIFFAWRMYHDALPVFSNLRHRGCDTEMKCFQCGFQVESTNHILFMCLWSRSLWKALNICWPEDRASTPADWLWHFMVERNNDELTLITIAAWLIWININLLVHGKDGWTTRQCEFKEMSLIEQFGTKNLISNRIFTFDPRSESGYVIWCDGSWSYKDSKGGYVAVLTHDEMVLSSIAGVQQSCASSFESELRELFAGLTLASNLALPGVTIVYDSSQAIWTK